MAHLAPDNLLLNHKYFFIYNNPSFKYQHELLAVTCSFLPLRRFLVHRNGICELLEEEASVVWLLISVFFHREKEACQDCRV